MTMSVKLAKIVRNNAGLTKSEMARKLGLSRQVYHYFETRNKNISEEDLAKLRQIYKGTDSEFCELIRTCGKSEED